MQKLVILLAALVVHLTAEAQTTFITAKTCGGGRAMIHCTGEFSGKISNIKFWAKYPNYSYNMEADSNSQWLCQTSREGQFISDVAPLKLTAPLSEPFKFNQPTSLPFELTLPPVGMTILIRDGKVFELVPGFEKDCPLDTF